MTGANGLASSQPIEQAASSFVRTLSYSGLGVSACPHILEAIASRWRPKLYQKLSACLPNSARSYGATKYGRLDDKCGRSNHRSIFTHRPDRWRYFIACETGTPPSNSPRWPAAKRQLREAVLVKPDVRSTNQPPGPQPILGALASSDG